MLMRLIFILTLFASAFLSFSIQPLLGKMLLPISGGAPAAWIVAMAFFQLALLGGYSLSHFLQRVSPVRHGLALLALYVIGLFFLPATVPHDDIQDQLAFNVLWLLVQTILIPFIALTATTSALLRIFSHTDEPTARDPYYLFITSNAGSLIGLFIYPLLLEPFFDLDQLSRLWFAVYGLLIVAVGTCLLLAHRNRDTMDDTPDYQASPYSAVTGKTILSWFVLAFVPCALSMSVTTMLTTDLGNLPLIWILPLGFYLLSFIAAFARKPLLQLDILHFLHVASAAFIFIYIAMNTLLHTQSLAGLLADMVVVLILFFVICWSCHQTLAAQRPAAQHLTFYYLIIALGGAAAGILNAFIIPVTLNSVIEFPFIVGLSLCLPMIWNKLILPKQARYQNLLFASLAVLTVFVLFGCYYSYKIQGTTGSLAEISGKYVLFICFFILICKPRLLALLTIPVTLYYMVTGIPGEIIKRDRNFFGSLVVIDNQAPHAIMRSLRHGNTTHGVALYDADGKPTLEMKLSYYSPKGALRDAYELSKPKRVATLGLGTGQLACYDKASAMTYFEIDPDIITVATENFPYLKACPPENIILGDARIALANDKTTYDLLILDVFSSDGIPSHILTLDAIRMYPQRLSKNGFMLFHISNRYLALAPQIAASTRIMGLDAYTRLDRPDKRETPFALASQWVAVPLDQSQGALLVKRGWNKIEPGRTQAWTDQRSSLLTAIRPIANRISGQADLVKP